MSFLPAALVARPGLLIALAFGLVSIVILCAVPNSLGWTTRVILSWDIACATFMVVMLEGMRDCSVANMQARAEAQDEGAGMILGLSILAAVASLAAIGVELSQAKASHGLVGGLRIALAFVTVVLSWSFVQTIFALHYAHEYYAPIEDEPASIRAGLGFPGDAQPDYWDFLHFALVIGVAGQTADVTFTSKAQRRTGTVHSVLSFAFNTIVLALSINLTASLFG
ncbi:MAG TPA: DUF1345 domain-containing protein [Caulobacteraceae bacterium]|jgi:uncharacterized membrane protein|nr:DUF1345 domain-containing protein [Caulobacteraceae bacterium]